MTHRKSQFSATPEARKVVARNTDLPDCEGLRVCAAMTSIAQFVLVSNRLELPELAILVQVGFSVIGFMIAAYLLRDRDLTSLGQRIVEQRGIFSSVQGMFRSLPLPQMATVIVLVLLLPKLLTMEGARLPDVAEIPEVIVKQFARYFADFQKAGFNGETLTVFPLIILFAPRRCLSLVLLSVLGSGLVLQSVGFFSGSVRPASILVAPSAFDLLSAGAFLAVVTRQRRIGRSESQIGLSAVISGLLMAGALVGYRLMVASGDLSSLSLFSAPSGFGVVNFVVEIIGTTLVSSLWWRDLGGMLEGVDRIAVPH